MSKTGVKRASEKERERLLRIISMCLLVERKGVNPFEIKVGDILTVLKKYLPNWKDFEDLILDAEAINSISSIIRLQGDWIKQRSSSLYIDPMLLELKIRLISPDELVKIFSLSWHPIIAMNRLSSKRVKEAIDYWNQLQKLEDRISTLPEPSLNLDFITLEELVKSKLVQRGTFQDMLQSLYEELKEKASVEGKVSYWDFVEDSTYEDTIFKAYLTSFLITYGYASMKINPMEEEVILIPFEEPTNMPIKKQSVSIPISIDYDSWKKWKAKRT
ncbi:MAG: hypothetical protein JSV20_01670 [Candidatus Bathyarchaeota archaeon]|nr:MAG: hypothetical protein JSV20_01670 [Candidatus Bathyarchaeota archaeon]